MIAMLDFYPTLGRAHESAIDRARATGIPRAILHDQRRGYYILRYWRPSHEGHPEFVCRISP